jgi:hypothetical protein
MELLAIIIVFCLFCLFCRVAYCIHKSRVEEAKSIPVVKSLTSGNIVSISDPLVERLKCNLILFLEAEDALSKSDSEGYIRLKSEAINRANCIIGKNKTVSQKKKTCCR